MDQTVDSNYTNLRNAPVSVSTVNTVLVLVFALIVTVLALLHVDKFLKLKAMDDCARSSSYQENLNAKAKVSYPVADVYKTCLKDKGYMQ